MEERTVDLIHLIVSIFKKWRSILVLFIIGGMLGAGFSFISNRNAGRTQAEIALIENMQALAESRQQYQDDLKHYENLTVTNLDSENIYIGNLEYYAYNCAEVNLIATKISSILKDAQVRSALSDILQLKDPRELTYLVKNSVTIQYDQSQNADKKNHGFRMEYTVLAGTADETKEVVSLLKDETEKVFNALTAEYSFIWKEISKNVAFGSSEELKQHQDHTKAKLEEQRANYEAAESILTPEEYAIYTTYVLTDKVEQIPEIMFPKNPLKLPVILAVAFAFLSCLWHLIAYFVRPELLTADEASAITKSSVIAHIHQTDGKKCFIDRWLNRLYSCRYPNPVSVSYAAAVLGKLDNTVLLYDENNEALCKLVADITEINSAIPCMPYIGASEDTVSAISGKANVVIAAQISVTLKSQLRRESEICGCHNIPLLGTILLAE